MRRFGKQLLLTSVVGVALAIGSNAHANECQRIKAAIDAGPMTPAPRLMYLARSGRWSEIPSDNKIPRSHLGSTVHFLYITTDLEDRGGAIVVKTAANLKEGQADNPNKFVHMNRGDFEAAFNANAGQAPADPTCPDPRRSKFSNGSVPATSYDDYHDYDYSLRDRLGDRQAIEDFHTEYRGRGRKCIATNETRSDNFLFFNFNSNRAQFSFNRTVVQFGLFSQILPSWNAKVPGSTRLQNQQVRIVPYKVKNGIACVHVQAYFANTLSFTRINNLEGSGLLRDGEIEVRLAD